MGWNVVPDGLREMLMWIMNRYNTTSNPLIYVTENGSAEHEPDLETATHDKKRRAFYEGHLKACAEAIRAGVNLAGFFAWSFMDNFEWQFGYQRRFGLVYVDFDTLERTPKRSALWYRNTILQNGAYILS
jgi:beta-glucosidase/6-phospho-beta-glucosidase/beta-galactosidase